MQQNVNTPVLEGYDKGGQYTGGKQDCLQVMFTRLRSESKMEHKRGAYGTPQCAAHNTIQTNISGYRPAFGLYLLLVKLAQALLLDIP